MKVLEALTFPRKSGQFKHERRADGLAFPSGARHLLALRSTNRTDDERLLNAESLSCTIRPWSRRKFS